MWVRETLEDLTSAEFACQLAQGESRRRGVDFEALLYKLDRRLEEMCVAFDGRNADTCVVNVDGMSSVVYDGDQRKTLLRRIVSTRESLTKAMEAAATAAAVTTTATTTAAESENGVDDVAAENLDEVRAKLTQEDFSTELYVRDDGSVDWDGALQDRSALKRFGTSVWARINGIDPDSVDDAADDDADDQRDGSEHSGAGHEQRRAVTATIVETDELRHMKAMLDEQTRELKDFETQHTALLNSAIPPSATNPTVNLALLSAPLRERIRKSAADLSVKRDLATYTTLNYELERIFTYLDSELGNTFSKGYIPLQDRLAVAEFGLLENQMAALAPSYDEDDSRPLPDPDALSIVADQLNDFKRRLGIDYYVNVGPSWDTDAVKLRIQDLLETSREGVAFYVKGCKLLSNDVVFCSRLLQRAVGGYTLRPREVRTLRRTLRDIVTFVPFVIILIIPLTPVGHVLVFGAIQRFFPDFFPSMFTERRQNLLELYESTEYSEITIDENWKEKALRFTEAVAFVLKEALRNGWSRMTTGENKQEGTKGVVGADKESGLFFAESEADDEETTEQKVLVD